MRDEDIDRVLQTDAEEIVPSSGFVVSVMEAVRLEVAAPPPIPFPWTRALPGLAAAVVALFAVLLVLVRFAQVPRGAVSAPPVATWSPNLIHVFQIAHATGADWVLLASLLALLSVRFAMRIAGARA